ncbi:MULTISPECIES: sigma-54 dependent transcriptional regulator [unclassified Guyparkeria]|uniref:sigma-54-dependent transcriptional regulator n=1 Tax=unclassified Guyparkeria TaxID=2626246 RepID=UPI000733951E|nr:MULTISPECIES: sigma-54 dependent transcriptional regulator [unclassified Guyparkeria]KTG16626.1 two-component system response regulator [Guyparkeria sp. XI15]OAE85660.1 two-component system response regulator [Guyparkeria sp. WRN-7]
MKTMAYCLIVDDEPDIRTLVALFMKREGVTTLEAADLSEAREQLAANETIDLCLADMRLPDGNGLDLVDEIRTQRPQLPVAVITAHGQVEAAVRALKAGAFDFINKPIEQDTLRRLLRDARNLQPPGAEPGDDHDGDEGSSSLIGQSRAMRQLREMIGRLARSQAPIFIQGESGTGKELVAREIHNHSSRAPGPFVPVNCGAIPGELIESELFGHHKGAFTGATRDKPGLFRAAEGGTLFLDEIAELPLPLQVSLLRVLQERRVRPVGGTEEVPIDVRIVSASHQDLNQAVSEGRFRQDLFFRLNVIGLRVPPLRERLDDLPALATAIIARLADRDQRPVPTIDPEVFQTLAAQPFPGNVRELENLLERAMALTDDDRITVEAVAPDPMMTAEEDIGASALGACPGFIPETDEQREVLAALQQTRWNRSEAARRLGLTLRQLRYRLQKWGVE